ncbi:AtpZ/AtpI family protein [Methylocaldum szegediense]|uniref:ATP synthase protein I n=1 Tax=Methylocaldum szegediense TaxID=73780 RepID=A0ABN8XBR9_9GAMM|nr:AtpZ/AtpI family protein [Methylocaldum szegediense]CAI8956744.1 ATP synthase protein I [Methylocaldum szegediense]
MDEHEKLRRSIERQARRMEQAERDRPTLLSQTAFLGVLALLLVVPIILGAYLGRWLDTLSEDYSIHWTISLIILGVIVGIFNVYLFVREH